jgi:hypothetical protein
MIYNFEQKRYELDLLVKQGYYDYQYVYVPKNTKVPDETYIEGNYYETENNYVIYVYHRAFGSRFDRLIGIKITNSLKQSFRF